MFYDHVMTPSFPEGCKTFYCVHDVAGYVTGVRARARGDANGSLLRFCDIEGPSPGVLRFQLGDKIEK